MAEHFLFHHSVSPPGRELGHPHICLPCALPKDCLSSPLTAGGTGQREWNSSRILSHLSMDFPNDQPIQAFPITEGHAYIFSCHLGFVTKLSCWQVDCRESRLQRLRPPIPTASHLHDLGPSKLSPLSTYDVLDQRFPFLSSSSSSQRGRLF